MTKRRKLPPVYFVCYDAVYKMAFTKAKEFIELGGEEPHVFGKRVKRSVNFLGTEGDEADAPKIIHWCAWRAYPCFWITDYTEDDWRTALASLEALESESA